MYGENGALLRAELASLLTQHRVQLRIGGDGTHSVIRSERVSLVWLNSPSNPTGRVLPVDHLRKVVAWCRERGALLVSSEKITPHRSGRASSGMLGMRRQRQYQVRQTLGRLS